MPQTTPWNPSKGTRIAIGAATLWPPVYLCFFFAFVFGSFLWTAPLHKSGPDLFFKVIFPLHCFTMLLNFALMAVYIVHAVKSDRLTQEMRIIWIIILFMGNMLAFPVYWWLYLRPSTAVVESGPPGPQRPGL